MPHILRGEINDPIDAMKGNATTGRLADLRVAANAVFDALELGEPTNAEVMHDKLHEVKEWLADDATSGAGASDTVLTFTTELNALL
jgi:hypothetical protein